jgi:hypothetical protein
MYHARFVIQHVSHSQMISYNNRLWLTAKFVNETLAANEHIIDKVLDPSICSCCRIPHCICQLLLHSICIWLQTHVHTIVINYYQQIYSRVWRCIWVLLLWDWPRSRKRNLAFMCAYPFPMLTAILCACNVCCWQLPITLFSIAKICWVFMSDSIIYRVSQITDAKKSTERGKLLMDKRPNLSQIRIWRPTVFCNYYSFTPKKLPLDPYYQQINLLMNRIAS